MSKLAPVFNIPNVPVVDREVEILRLCKDKKVLHIGCADAPYTTQRGDYLLHTRLGKVTDRLWGIDLSPEGCSLLGKLGFNNILEGEISTYTQELIKENFDIILAGEVIEHTENPGSFLKDIAKVMTSNTVLLLTTVNTPSITSLIFSLMRKEKVHPDHNYYFSYYTINHFMKKCGLIPSEIYYYKVNNTIIDKLLGFACYISPVFSDGIIVKAQLQQ